MIRFSCPAAEMGVLGIPCPLNTIAPGSWAVPVLQLLQRVAGSPGRHSQETTWNSGAVPVWSCLPTRAGCNEGSYVAVGTELNRLCARLVLLAWTRIPKRIPTKACSHCSIKHKSMAHCRAVRRLALVNLVQRH